MTDKYISADHILKTADEYFNKKDYKSAEQHLLFWLSKSIESENISVEIMLRNELMGLYRKTGRKDEAVSSAKSAINKADTSAYVNSIDKATTYLNGATVYKAFGMSEKALSLYEKAKKIYESSLSETDSRLGGLYNNMALSLVDLKRYKEAKDLYDKAIKIMTQVKNGILEVAITYLNMASAAEAEMGLEDADGVITYYLDKAEVILNEYPTRDGYYAFVCEKCASVFGYYGRFIFEKELNERARSFYENERA